ncbi:IS110 family transposase [Chroococcidiopsis sp. CCMEE 29]|uniref:IS110 family transposase n=1 Tax=Chroococcidiopsis sp. CCMEE 29 TaxID=155894 RepID=UPI0020203035|nr:IS110 family transposase [Chroococcidiopsis sp. CCMEE 29]
MKSLKQASYTGKEVFIGIDVHKKSYSVVARVDKEVIKKWTTVASPKELSQQLQKYFSGATIHSVYEAGFSGFALHRELVKYGIDNIVVHAAAIEVAANDRVKTDKRDAQKMAALLEAGRVRGNRIPTEQQEQRRMLTRTRQQLVEERTAIKNKIRMKFHQLGLIQYDENRPMSHKLVREIVDGTSSSELRIVIEAHWNIWRKLDEEICKLTQAIKEQAKTDPNEATYRSAPGVGPLSARILANELGDMSQFNNERQLFSFTGLTPAEYSSGDNIRRGHISRQGNSRLRGILVESAWRAIEKDTALGEFFERLYPRTGKKRAIVAVARKLIGRIRAAFHNQVNYQMEYRNSKALTTA